VEEEDQKRMFPIHLVSMLRMCGALTIPGLTSGSNISIGPQMLLPAGVGDLDNHTNLGAIIQTLNTNVFLGQAKIPAVPSIISMASPDIIGLIPHIQGLPIPIQGEPTVRIGQGSGAAGIGMMQSLGFGNFGALSIGELVSVGTQAIGMVQNFTGLGGGGAIAQLSNLQGNPIGPGTTVTGQTSGYTFTFGNYIDSRVVIGEYSYPDVNSISNALVLDDGQYIVIDDYFNLYPTQNLTASVITT